MRQARKICTRPKGRTEKGSALTEAGPALFLLIFFGLFVVLDVIGLCFNYCACLNLNNLQLREAAKLPLSVATDPKGPVRLAIPAKFKASVMGGLCGLPEVPDTAVTYKKHAGNIYVTVSTNATVQPTLTIPVFPGVPGLGAPAVFNVTNARLLENPRNYVL